MFDLEQLTTTQLIDKVLQDPDATQRELLVAYRLIDALEEVDVLNKDVGTSARALAVSIHGDS